MFRKRANATRQAEPRRTRPKRAASASAKQAAKVHVLTTTKRTSKKKSEAAQPATSTATGTATSDERSVDCPACHAEIGKAQLPRHLKTHGNFGVWYLCIFCDHCTRELHNLASHIKTHTKHNHLMCAYDSDTGGRCTDSFQDPEERCDHRWLKHQRLPPFFDYKPNKGGRRSLAGTSDPQIVDMACRDFELGCPPQLLQNAPAQKHQLYFSPIGMPYRVLVLEEEANLQDLPEPVRRAVKRRKPAKGRTPINQEEGRVEEVESVEDEDGATEMEGESEDEIEVEDEVGVEAEDEIEAEVEVEVESESECEGEGEGDRLPAYGDGPSQHPSLAFPTPPLTPPSTATTPPRHFDPSEDAALSLLALQNSCPPRPELNAPPVHRLPCPVIDHPRRFGAHRYQPYVAGYASRYQSRQTSSGLTGAFHPRYISQSSFHPYSYSR